VWITLIARAIVWAKLGRSPRTIVEIDDGYDFEVAIVDDDSRSPQVEPVGRQPQEPSTPLPWRFEGEDGVISRSRRDYFRGK
jgi:hypothetical protein